MYYSRCVPEKYQSKSMLFLLLQVEASNNFYTKLRPVITHGVYQNFLIRNQFCFYYSVETKTSQQKFRMNFYSRCVPKFSQSKSVFTTHSRNENIPKEILDDFLLTVCTKMFSIKFKLLIRPILM